MEVYIWNNRCALCGCIHITCDVTPEAKAWLPVQSKSWNSDARPMCVVVIGTAGDLLFRAVTLLFLSSIKLRVCPWSERKCCYVTGKFLLLRHRQLNNAIDWQSSVLLIHLFCVWCTCVWRQTVRCSTLQVFEICSLWNATHAVRCQQYYEIIT